MKLYRGYNSQYNNYGIPSGSNHIWTTDDINYANEYYDSVVEFEINENELNVADIYDLWEVLGDEEGEFDPIDLDNEEAQALIDNNYNCLIFDTPSNETVYVLLDKKLIKSVRNIDKQDELDDMIQEVLKLAGVKELNESYMKTDKGIIYYTKSENVFLNTMNARFKNIPVRVIYDLKNRLYIFGDANTFVHTQMMNYILVNTKLYSTKGWNQSYFNEDGNYWRDGYIEDNLFNAQCALFQIIWDDDIEKYTKYDGYDTGYFTIIDNKMYVVCRQNELKYCEKVPLLWNNHWFSQKYDNMKDFQLNESIFGETLGY